MLGQAEAHQGWREHKLANARTGRVLPVQVWAEAGQFRCGQRLASASTGRGSPIEEEKCSTVPAQQLSGPSGHLLWAPPGSVMLLKY